MKTTICKHCGKTEKYHCVFEPLVIPNGCVCDTGSWDGEIAPICDKYKGDGIEYCHKCEHDKGCHGGSNDLQQIA